MRLKPTEITAIKHCVQQSFNQAKVYLFGSRTDDNKKGGDIDLYIETDIQDNLLEKEIKFLVNLKKLIGEQKIDLVINNHTCDKLIYKQAKKTGIEL
ncbi:nucleotidyltransferase domain-containing protein [Candidatus Halobeggiatoa sp. HSG11]|nr:nucleotidyltransferase domain-containing protein [Candidatus Halobeggiatoa sp. HSG11]